MEFTYGTPPRRARGCETLAPWTDLWMQTLLRVRSARPPWGWGIPDPQEAGSVARGRPCSPSTPQPGTTMLLGAPRGFSLGCAVPDTFPPARCGCGTLRGPGASRGAAAAEVCCCVAPGRLLAGSGVGLVSANAGRAGGRAGPSRAGNKHISPFSSSPPAAARLGRPWLRGLPLQSITGRAVPAPGRLPPPRLALLPGELLPGCAGGGAREEEGGLVTKLEKEKLQPSAGRPWGVRSHARKHRTGSTAKYLYRRKQAAQQLDMGACQGSPLPPHAASSTTGWRSPRATIPARAPLPGGGV